MIAQKYGFSKVDSEKVARIVQYADIVKEFSQATNTSTLETTDRGLKLEGNGKADLLNQASFYLSEGNTFELAKILYTAKGSGKENIIDEVINKVNQILEEGIKNKKEQTTILPQTTQADIIQSAKQYGRQERIIDDNGKEYVVYIVHVDDIPHFASFTHCTSPGLSNTKKSVFNNEFLFKDYFSTPLNDKVISTSYIGDSKHLGGMFGNFLLNVPNTKQHHFCDGDMYSIARNTDSLGKEFDYTRMSKEGKHFNSIFKPEKLYREAMEKITNELGDEILNYEKWEAGLKKYAPELRNTKGKKLVDGLFAPPSGYNEMIVSQPEITAFFREYLPSDNRFDNRLLEAAKRGLPIVLWGKKDGSIY